MTADLLTVPDEGIGASDRSRWVKLRFDQLAESITDRVDDPAAAGVDYYVGLEHLDPESLKIRRWGVPTDVEATKLRFQPGDIIFGRRRAYQRKLAVAEFKGICSAHALVLRPRPEHVVPEFLPFFMQSEVFFDRALAISVGSLSPTINWKTLAQQKFFLPPQDEQRRIAAVLWAADQVTYAMQESVDRGIVVRDRMLASFTHQGLHVDQPMTAEVGETPTHWKTVPLGELLEICQYGLSIPASDKGLVPIFRMMNIENGVVVENDMKFVDLESPDVAQYELAIGDILFNRTNSADLVGKVGIYRLEGSHVFASYLIRLRPIRERIHPEYLNYYLNSVPGQQRILEFATRGVSQSNINAKNLKKVIVPLPTLTEQSQIIETIRAIERVLTEMNDNLMNALNLRKLLLRSMIDVNRNVD